MGNKGHPEKTGLEAVRVHAGRSGKPGQHGLTPSNAGFGWAVAHVSVEEGLEGGGRESLEERPVPSVQTRTAAAEV